MKPPTNADQRRSGDPDFCLSRGRYAAAYVGALVLALLVLGCIWLPYMPGAAGRMGADYAYWLPNLLAGAFWHLTNGWSGLPWFNPAACGGVPLFANPQGAYLSLPQFLTFAIGPLRAVQASFLAFAAFGFIGAHHLARARFGLSRPASLMAAMLFLLNGFYAARLVVGHLSFAPFMLLPSLAACLLGRPAEAPCREPWPEEVLRCCGFGLVTAVMLQAGMAVLMPPVFLCLLILLAMHLIATGGSPVWPLARLAAGTGIGLVLCAGKLAAVGALMSHVPRNAYPLPGYASLPETALIVLRTLFLQPSATMTRRLLDTPLRFESHEFAYGVGPVPLVLMLAAAWIAWRRRRGGPRADWKSRLRWEALAVLLAVPLALNTVAPVWTPLLKSLPVIGNSSSLLRWFAAYILPAILGGAIALDRLAARTGLHRARMAAVGIGATIACLLVADRSAYGPAGTGLYDPARIQQGWRAAAGAGRAPPVTALVMSADAQGQPRMELPGQDALVAGQSQISCYEPLFGYFLESFPRGALHPGSVFAQADGRLNLKSPACYVFPGANACRPGDAFAASDLRRAGDFTAWRPFAWNKPGWARAADWLNLAGLASVALALAAAAALRIQRGRRSR